MPDPDDFVWAYDTRNSKPGEPTTKLPHKVPRSHLRIFPFLSLTPVQKASARRQATPPAPPESTED